MVVVATDHCDPRGERPTGTRRRRRIPGGLPLIPTPPCPEHPADPGLSASTVRTLQQFFGTDAIGWSDTNNAGLTRSFTRLSGALEEIVSVRVWSGSISDTPTSRARASART